MQNIKTIQYYTNAFPNQVQEMIDDIMDNFDFEKVHDVMEHLGWSWVVSGSNLEVPDIGTIRRVARKCLRDATFNLSNSIGAKGVQNCEVGSGGLVTVCEVCDIPDEDDQKKNYVDDAANQLYINLSFKLTDWTGWCIES